MKTIARAVSAMLAAALMCASPAVADVFTVRGVEVDETAETAAQSRVQAISVGQLIAARRLIERLTLEDDQFAAPPLDEARAARLVAGFQVEEEALAGARYIARLSVAFDPGAVRNLLENYGVPYVLSTARPAVVAPLWQDGEDTRLWVDNPWLEAWHVAGTADELVPVIAPSGDLNDISAIDAPRARALDLAAMRRLAQNYGATRVLVALAAPSGNDGLMTARMVGYDFSQGGAERTDFGSLGVAEPVELARAAADMLQDGWKRRVMVRDPFLNELSVSVLYDSTEGWMELQSVLAGEPLVQVAQLEALTNDGALMSIEHRGQQEQLAFVLREHGAQLRQTPQGWVISRVDGARPPSAPGGAAPEGQPGSPPGSPASPASTP